MRHLGVHVGNFYLVEKAGGEAFTDEDEELLVLFAAQAATAIAYRAGRRARADLEALIETSPVGVVVFEARTGALVSLNREAARIVKSLCDPGQSAEQLLGVITCRRADGREIALDRLPLARALDRAETVRAEEVVLSVPDGRSVTTLIRDPDGPDDALASRSKPVPFVLGELAIDYDRRRVTVAGRAVTLTPTEYELLRALAQGAGRILTHEDLLRKVWAGRGHGKVKPKIVRAYVKRLRHRLGDDAARPAWIVNERGVGYRMPRPGEAGDP